MKAHAATFVLLMIASSLAGCTTAGTDGVPEVTLDDEDIETFLDDYFQDFVNNSSVVINQEIHYHNETTVNEGDDSSVMHYNGSSPQSYMVIERTYLASDFDLENREDRVTNTFSRTSNVYDWDSDSYSTMTLEISCSVFHLDGPYGSYWNDSVYGFGHEDNWPGANWYRNQWDNLYNDSINWILNELLQEEGQDIHEIRVTCDPYYASSVNDGEFIHLGDILVPAGHGMICHYNPQMYRNIPSPYTEDFPGSFGPNYMVSVYMYEDERYAGCNLPHGDGTSDTTISLFVEYSDLGLSYANEYRFYFTYQLVEVTNGELA